MPQDKDITTFHFLEAIQDGFLSENQAAEDGKVYDVRRLINFFNNTATLHILKRDADKDLEAMNGHADLVATLNLQNVAENEELPSFAIFVSCKPFEANKKLLHVVYNNDTLAAESKRVVQTLKTEIAAIPKEEAPQEAPTPAEEQAPAPTAEAEAATPAPRARRSSRETSGAEASSSEASARPRRRSLRNRNTEENAEASES